MINRGKIDSNFAYEVLVRRNFMQCIYLFTPEEAEIVGNTRQSSSVVNSLVSFFLWRPMNIPFVCGFSPSLHMITLKNPQLPLCFSGSHKYNKYDKATYTVSSNFVHSLAPRLSMKSLLTEDHQCTKGVSQIHPPVSGVNFSDNISIGTLGVSRYKEN